MITIHGTGDGSEILSVIMEKIFWTLNSSQMRYGSICSVMSLGKICLLSTNPHDFKETFLHDQCHTVRMNNAVLWGKVNYYLCTATLGLLWTHSTLSYFML